jgi:hypothetical protein
MWFLSIWQAAGLSNSKKQVEWVLKIIGTTGLQPVKRFEQW